MEEHEFDMMMASGDVDFSGVEDVEVTLLGHNDEDDESSLSEIEIANLMLGYHAEDEKVEEELKTEAEAEGDDDGGEEDLENEARHVEEAWTVMDMEPATPLEELLREVGLINLTKQYSRVARPRIYHDFRWLAHPADLMFRGEKVIAMIFPPAKLDLAPSSVVSNLAIRDGKYVTVTGHGSHLFMGAIPATPDVMCVCEIVTCTKSCYFQVTRNTVSPANGPVRAWTPKGEFFNCGRNIQWNDRLIPGDNIIMVDGDVWYYPGDRTPVVTIKQGKMVDRKGRTLEPGDWAVRDGEYTFDIDRKTLDEVVWRPPVSWEVYCAWKKLKRLPNMMYGVKNTRDRFDIDPQDYDCRDVSALIENPKLRSPSMMRRKDKFREACKVKYLAEVSRNIFGFAVYEISSGRCWVDHETVTTYVIPCAVFSKYVLELDGRGLSEWWRRVEVLPGVVRALLYHLRQRGDVVVVKCQVSRARPYCTIDWSAQQIRDRRALLVHNWHNPDVLIAAVRREWMEYFSPPEDDDDVSMLFLDAR